jgi:omega-amidase
MTKLRISLAQFDVQMGNPRVNWTKAQEVIAEAARQKAHVVVMPELWDMGYQLDKAKEFASSLSGGLFSQVSALSTQHKVFIIGSMMEKRGLGVSNTAAIFSPNRGVMGAYRKIHLFPMMQEDQWLTPGEAVSVFDLPWGTTGIAICYDLRFPELFRRYATDGAKIVFVPAQWPKARIEHFRNLIRARAIENQMYIVAVNRVGEDMSQGEERPAQRYGGYSAIIDPNGETIIELGYGEAQAMAEVDLALVDKLRRYMPVLDDRRTEFYGY